jgi:endonuclease-8
MPEGDVVWRTASRLNQALAGRVLVHTDLRWPSLATRDLAGRTVHEALARGKHLLIRLSADGGSTETGSTDAGSAGGGPESALTLHSHLRMDGSWRIDPTAESPAGVVRRQDADVRVVLANDEWTATGLRLGMLDLVATRDEHSVVGHLGPDVLGPDWDLAQVLETLRAQPDRPIGEALLDQRVLAGIGTFYLAETMFLAGRAPWTPVRDLMGTDENDPLTRVVERARRLLQLNRDRGGQVTTGDARPGHEAFVHGRAGHPCRRCGTTVRVARLGAAPTDRVAFYCPTCQRGPTPTDDGTQHRPLGSSRRAR